MNISGVLDAIGKLFFLEKQQKWQNDHLCILSKESIFMWFHTLQSIQFSPMNNQHFLFPLAFFFLGSPRETETKMSGRHQIVAN